MGPAGNADVATKLTLFDLNVMLHTGPTRHHLRSCPHVGIGLRACVLRRRWPSPSGTTWRIFSIRQTLPMTIIIHI
uniref:Uncharacterized protein n=1 Tax=Aegilops tauschii subsp. strangulata TaxID=200361 RepID=A0A453DU51_AEGTS